MSRHMNTNRAVVLYGRARRKIALESAQKFTAITGFDQVVRMFGIVGAR